MVQEQRDLVLILLQQMQLITEAAVVVELIFQALQVLVEMAVQELLLLGTNIKINMYLHKFKINI